MIVGHGNCVFQNERECMGVGNRMATEVLLGMKDTQWRSIFQTLLRKLDCSTICTGSGLRALNIAQSRKVDLLIADESLTGASPAELVLNLNDLLPCLPLVLVTGPKVSQLTKIWKHCRVYFFGSRFEALQNLERALEAIRSNETSQ